MADVNTKETFTKLYNQLGKIIIVCLNVIVKKQKKLKNEWEAISPIPNFF